MDLLFKLIIDGNIEKIIGNVEELSGKIDPENKREREIADIKLFNNLINIWFSYSNLIEDELVSFILKSEVFSDSKTYVNVLSYLVLLNAEMYDYFLVDQINYVHYYLGDIETYTKWFWIQYLQRPLSYNSDGTLNEDKFCKAFIRMHFTRSLIEMDFNSDNLVNSTRKDLQTFFHL